MPPTRPAARRLAAGHLRGLWRRLGRFDRGRLEAPELVRRIAARTGLPPDAVQRRGRCGAGRAAADARHRGPAAPPARAKAAACTSCRTCRGPMPTTWSASTRSSAASTIRRDLGACPADQARAGHLRRLAARHFGAAPAQLLFIDDVPDNVQRRAARRLERAAFRRRRRLRGADCVPAAGSEGRRRAGIGVSAACGAARSRCTLRATKRTQGRRTVGSGT